MKGCLFTIATFLSTCVPATGQCEGSRLIPNQLVSSDNLGSDVSISGEWLAVGAHGTNEAVYMYRLSGRNWFLEQVIVDAATTGISFGFRLSLEGTRLAVGAPGGLGAVFFYDYDGVSWVLTQKLVPPDLVSGDLFGDDVDLDGDRLVVGARGVDDIATDAGAFYVFDFDGVLWSETAKLMPSDSASADFLGRPIAVDGNRAVVGATSAEFNGLASAGVAYVFEYNGAQWSETARFSAGDGVLGLRFPTSIDMEGDRIVAGSFAANGDGTVFVNELQGTTWVETQTLVPGDIQPLDQFGISLEMDGDMLAVGSSQGFFDTGKVTVFQDVGGSYVDLVSFDPTGADLFSNVGLSCAIDGDLVATGGWFHDGNGLVDTGGLWTYSLDDTLCPILTPSATTISLSEGGTTLLTIAAGPSNAHRRFVTGGSISGTDPGFPLGSLQIPLNADDYLLQTLVPNSSANLVDSFGFLNSAGAALTQFSVVPNSDPSLLGLPVSHATVIFEFGPLQFLEVSNPVTVTLTQ